MSADSVNIFAGTLEFYSPQCKIFSSDPSKLTPERQSPSLWVCECCRSRLTIPLHGPSVLSPESHNLKLESLSTTVTGSQYHRRPWPVGLLSPRLIILSSMSLSIVVKISQTDRVSHPGTVRPMFTDLKPESLGAVARGSLSRVMSLSVRLLETPSHKHGLVAMLLTDYVDLVLLALAVRCHLATQLWGGRGTTREVHGSVCNTKARGSVTHKMAILWVNTTCGIISLFRLFGINCCFYFLADWSWFRWFQQPNLLLRWLLSAGSTE